jgi:hypothetical protein
MLSAYTELFLEVSFLLAFPPINLYAFLFTLFVLNAQGFHSP